MTFGKRHPVQVFICKLQQIRVQVGELEWAENRDVTSIMESWRNSRSLRGMVIPGQKLYIKDREEQILG